MNSILLQLAAWEDSKWESEKDIEIFSEEFYKKLKRLATEISLSQPKYCANNGFFLNKLNVFIEEMRNLAPDIVVKAFLVKAYFEELEGLSKYKTRLLSPINLNEIWTSKNYASLGTVMTSTDYHSFLVDIATNNSVENNISSTMIALLVSLATINLNRVILVKDIAELDSKNCINTPVMNASPNSIKMQFEKTVQTLLKEGYLLIEDFALFSFMRLAILKNPLDSLFSTDSFYGIANLCQDGWRTRSSSKLNSGLRNFISTPTSIRAGSRYYFSILNLVFANSNLIVSTVAKMNTVKRIQDNITVNLPERVLSQTSCLLSLEAEKIVLEKMIAFNNGSRSNVVFLSNMYADTKESPFESRNGRGIGCIWQNDVELTEDLLSIYGRNSSLNQSNAFNSNETPSFLVPSRLKHNYFDISNNNSKNIDSISLGYHGIPYYFDNAAPFLSKILSNNSFKKLLKTLYLIEYLEILESLSSDFIDTFDAFYNGDCGNNYRYESVDYLIKFINRSTDKELTLDTKNYLINEIIVVPKYVELFPNIPFIGIKSIINVTNKPFSELYNSDSQKFHIRLREMLSESYSYYSDLKASPTEALAHDILSYLERKVNNLSALTYNAESNPFKYAYTSLSSNTQGFDIDNKVLAVMLAQYYMFRTLDTDKIDIEEVVNKAANLLLSLNFGSNAYNRNLAIISVFIHLVNDNTEQFKNFANEILRLLGKVYFLNTTHSTFATRRSGSQSDLEYNHFLKIFPESSYNITDFIKRYCTFNILEEVGKILEDLNGSYTTRNYQTVFKDSKYNFSGDWKDQYNMYGILESICYTLDFLTTDEELLEFKKILVIHGTSNVNSTNIIKEDFITNSLKEILVENKYKISDNLIKEITDKSYLSAMSMNNSNRKILTLDIEMLKNASNILKTAIKEFKNEFTN